MDGLSFSRGNEVIRITYLPGYKKPCLTMGNKHVIQKIASFDNEEYAEEFCNLLMRWFNLEKIEEKSNEL